MKGENTTMPPMAIQSAYDWGRRLQYAHVAAFALALINGLANYYQADALDNFLKGMNINATPEEVYYLYDITSTVSGVMALLLIGIHFLAWWYVSKLINTDLVPGPTALDKGLFLFQPAAGLLWWFKKREAHLAYDEDRAPGSSSFISLFWGVLAFSLVLFFGSYFWLLTIPVSSLQTDVLISLTYAHFSLAVANFVFLLSHVLGWRTIYRIQQLLQ